MLDLYMVNLVEDYLKYGTCSIYTINIVTKKYKNENYTANIIIKCKQNILTTFSIYIGDNFNKYNILRSLSIYKHSILNKC